MPVLGPKAGTSNNHYEDQALPRNTVHEVVRSEILAVKFTDGYGKTQMRLVVMIEGQPFLLQPEIGDNAKAAQKWFTTQIAEKLGTAPKKRKTRKKKAAPVAAEAPTAPAIDMDAM